MLFKYDLDAQKQPQKTRKRSIICSCNSYQSYIDCFEKFVMPGKQKRLVTTKYSTLYKKKSTVSEYSTPNSSNYSLSKCRLELFNKSLNNAFIPDTLGVSTRETTPIKIFKETFAKITFHTEMGWVFFNIVQTRLRHKCILNF